MARITRKSVQCHAECICGRNEVYEDGFHIPWRELAKHGIKRKIDKKTGERFLLWYYKINECNGHDEF